ncbi:MAG: hypothetical protein F6K41_28540 [Symploca sp. SIO3E6]|nr:hypothetical protein [Caldora sp. SIO3E6]
MNTYTSVTIRQRAEGRPDDKIFFTTMHESPSLRVSASPRPRVSFKLEGRREGKKLLGRKELSLFIRT